jgi:soluble lytic murein transglycosylase-like protein
VSPACKLPAIPLFGQNTRHSSVPAAHRTAVARRGGQGRPPSRRVSASPLRAASTMAALRSLGIVVWIVAILAASMLSIGSAHAERSSPPAHRVNRVRVDPFVAAYVTEASRRFGLPECWIRAVMRVESDGKQRARSKKGAMGLMQIMPGTWAELRARYRLGIDPYNPRDNILAGAAYSGTHRSLRHGVPCRLQCRTRALRTSSGNGATAAGGDANLRRDARANDRKQAGQRADWRRWKVVCLGELVVVRDA